MTEVAGSVDEVLALYERWGLERYDEEVTQLEHALQCAALAREAGAADALVVASLLHDVGHLLELAGGRFRSDQDERHEARGARFLSGLFGRDVTEPIALHVRAKRYLCAVDADYAAALSTGSTISLAKQGGPMTTTEATAFERQPGWESAVQLRRWDDQAKILDLDVGPLEQHRALLQRVARD
ncbi:MAG TPA: HD domain-containing protein [Acidimicrobiales bacterium]|nr:HD domain-containing protein [Acidimicrobiales bacterium]